MKLKAFLMGALFLFLAFLQPVQSYRLLGYGWSNGKFEYYINPNSRDVSETTALAMIRKGARAWSPWCRPVYKGVTDKHKIANDGQNTVFFRQEVYGALATTYVFSAGDQILDFDMVFWDKAWKFYGGADGCVDGFYMMDVATHEFGHAIGLGHSGIHEATMFRRCGYCNNDVRTLATDDIHAVTKLYGPAITGTVN